MQAFILVFQLKDYNLTLIEAWYGLVIRFWPVKHKQNCGGKYIWNSLKDRKILFLPFPADWNAGKVIRAQAVILDSGKVCARSLTV